ncbi:MAG: hypothetical protein ACMXYB_04855 [Candidatus Woesearchaeota archaeon]
MTLFDKNKHKSSSSSDLSQIKQQASGSSSQLPTFNSNPNNQSPNQQFVNPFSPSSNQPNNHLNNVDLNSSQLSMQEQIQQSQNSNLNYSQSIDSSSNFKQTPPTFTNNSNQEGYLSKDEAEQLIVQTVEGVLEDKWEDITKNVRKVVEWKDKVESQITLVKEDIISLQDAFTTLEKRLISKLNNYDKSILDVGSEIKALDKVFQKITPTLVNNVTELGKIAKELKSVSHSSKNYEE